jgi:hypothetical protein
MYKVYLTVTKLYKTIMLVKVREISYIRSALTIYKLNCKNKGQDFYVGSGSCTPELYSLSPDWLEYCFIHVKSVACREF